MKTITIKLPESFARDLEIFLKRTGYPSKSEFIRNLIIDKLGNNKEDAGWLILAQKSLEELWDNNKDDKIWERYLNDGT